MSCCFKSRTSSHPKPHQNPTTTTTTHEEETLLLIPGAALHLMEGGETAELARGDLVLLRFTDGDLPLATVARVGGVQWPLTKDEPVVKVDALHYLFTLKDDDGGGEEFLNYGVSFSGADEAGLASLDEFLRENTCFSTPKTGVVAPSSLVKPSSGDGYWKEHAPRVEDYNGVLARAIAGGTGQIVKGIFLCGGLYVNQVQKGGDIVRSTENKAKKNDDKKPVDKKRGTIQKSLNRVRKVSEMTEKMSQALLNGVITVTSSVTAPLVQSHAGKSFFAMVPGEVLLATLDAVNRVLDAVEAAEKQSLSASSYAVSGVVSKRFGENAGQATEDVFATAGHAVGTVWNIFKIRKAVNPSTSVRSSILKSAVKKKRP
ncbi:hypothetical protein QJS10_CPB18g00988 [Acorus calamus]|uniref:Senescence domain-containing protein n=1 Tax=Acorus calamus TaxID=4465 RepID=A0AAV9CMR9_ACOCL|nr:hypothetical protein QJS10_CPB18g00988 [Acorus calamus]